MARYGSVEAAANTDLLSSTPFGQLGQATQVTIRVRAAAIDATKSAALALEVELESANVKLVDTKLPGNCVLGAASSLSEDDVIFRGFLGAGTNTLSISTPTDAKVAWDISNP